MGPIKDILGMIPGMGQMQIPDDEVNEKSMSHVEAIIQSMTREERRNPNLLNASRKKRIASGSGRTIQEINRLLKQFEEMRKMMKSFSGMAGKKNKKGMLPFLR